MEVVNYSQPQQVSVFDQLRKEAQALVSSGFLPSAITKPEQAIVIKMYADVLKLPWIIAFNTIHVISGKPTISPQLMIALVRNSGKLTSMKIEANNEQATVTVQRCNEPPHTSVFTMEDAKRMGLLDKAGSQWPRQPKTMLTWRAVAAAFRLIFPDILMGFYTPEEMGAEVMANDEGEMQIVAPPPPMVSAKPEPVVIEPIDAHAPAPVSTVSDDVKAAIKAWMKAQVLEADELLAALGVKHFSAYGDWLLEETATKATSAVNNYMNAQAVAADRAKPTPVVEAPAAAPVEETNSLQDMIEVPELAPVAGR